MIIIYVYIIRSWLIAYLRAMTVQTRWPLGHIDSHSFHDTILLECFASYGATKVTRLYEFFLYFPIYLEGFLIFEA
jgi:hypothetical protein